MALGPYKKIYPGENRILFDGGLNNKFQRALIEDNESPDCANVVYTNGAVETRQGAQKVNTTSVGNFACDGLYARRAADNSETMCAFYGGSMYTLSGTAFVSVASAVSAFTAGQQVVTAQYQGYLFVGNGGASPYKWDGTYFTRHGVPSPTTTAAVASNGVGNLTASGNYRYKVTYVNSALVESDVGPATATFVISTTSGQNTLSSIPLAPTSYGVSSRYLYRTPSTGTAFFRLATLSDNTTTTYSDNTADSGLGVAAPTDQGVPPKYSTLVYHQDRLFCNDPANPNYVVYSNLANPYSFPSTNFVRVGDSTSDLVKALGVYENALIVFCERSIWAIYMKDQSPANWSPPIRLRSPYGSKSPACILNYQNKLLFPALQNGVFVGFAALKGDVVDTTTAIQTVLTAGSDLKSLKIEPDMFNIQNNIANISGAVYKNKAYIACTYGSSATFNNRYYVYDFSLSDLSKDQDFSWVPNTGLSPGMFAIYAGSLYFGNANNTGTGQGNVYKLESGAYNDDGAGIDSYAWTKEFPGYKQDTNFSKDFRYANLFLDTLGNYSMNLTYRTDSDSGSGNTVAISLDPGGSEWGTLVWGTDAWGGGTAQKEIRQFLGNSFGKRIQFKFDNQNVANQRFRVQGMNFLYNRKGYR